MDLSGIGVVFVVLVGAFIFNRILRSYLVSKMHRQAYIQKVNRVLSDPESRPKGRFE